MELDDAGLVSCLATNVASSVHTTLQVILLLGRPRRRLPRRLQTVDEMGEADGSIFA